MVRNNGKWEITTGRTASSILISSVLNARLLDDIHSTQQMIIRGIDTKRKVGEGSFSLDALGMVIFKISKNPSWEPVLNLILNQYSREELNCPAFLGETYLFRAVNLGSPLATRLLLAHGADPNYIPEYDSSRHIAALKSSFSPLHACLHAERPPECLDLLLDYGADTTVLDVNQFSFYESSITTFQKRTLTLDTMLSRDLSKSQLLEILHTSFDISMAINVEMQNPTYTLSIFRYLLQHETVRSLMNHPKNGLSLLHWAAFAIDYELVLLLLEAGAQCDRLYLYHEVLVSPLHLLMAVSELEWMLLKHNQTPLWGEKRCRSAFKTASLLLKHTHHAQSKLFISITDLHLAAYMDDLESVQRLMRLQKADIHARGIWPIVNYTITPRQLFLGSRHPESIFYIRTSKPRRGDHGFPDLPPGLHDSYEQASNYLQKQICSTDNGIHGFYSMDVEEKNI